MHQSNYWPVSQKERTKREDFHRNRRLQSPRHLSREMSRETSLATMSDIRAINYTGLQLTKIVKRLEFATKIKCLSFLDRARPTCVDDVQCTGARWPPLLLLASGSHPRHDRCIERTNGKKQTNCKLVGRHLKSSWPWQRKKVIRRNAILCTAGFIERDREEKRSAEDRHRRNMEMQEFYGRFPRSPVAEEDR